MKAGFLFVIPSEVEESLILEQLRPRHESGLS